MGRRYGMSCSRTELLKKIQCNNFAAYDMLLYLDTHSDDEKAFKIFQSLVKKTNDLRKEFEENFGPTSQFGTAKQESFNWLDNPWPWEKEANE
jgi:spore coat protein JB